MSLKGLPNVLDIRTVGLTAGIDLALASRTRRAGAPTTAMDAPSTTRT